jgi:Protein of unknown function (DUF1254)
MYAQVLEYPAVGPSWKGDLPAGVRPLPPSRTPYVLIFGRTLVDGPADIPAVIALQPLGQDERPTAGEPRCMEAFRCEERPARGMEDHEPGDDREPTRTTVGKTPELFGRVGVGGPYQAIDRLDDATKRGLARAKPFRIAGSALLRSKLLPGSMPIFFNCAIIGWSVMCGGSTFSSSAAYAKNLPAGIVSAWIIGGVFISIDGSIFTFTGFAGLPHSERGVTYSRLVSCSASGNFFHNRQIRPQPASAAGIRSRHPQPAVLPGGRFPARLW